MQAADTNVSSFIERANEVITEVAAKSRVGTRFIPRYKLRPTSKQVVPDIVVHDGTVNDVDTIPLAEIWVSFTIDWQWLTQRGQASGLTQARIAGQTYSRLEDRLLFLGQDKNLALNGGKLPDGVRVDRGWPNDGLLSAPKLYGTKNDIYAGVAAAYGQLEAQSATGPFAIVMGSDLADKSEETPQNFTDSHRRRIENLLGTVIVRSTVIPSWVAILLSGAKLPNASESSPGVAPSGPVDRAVAVEPEVRFLGNIDAKGRYEFWVIGSLTLRLKDSWGVFQVLFQ